METFIKNNNQITKDNITEIADKLLNKTILISGNKSYRICEIEFYLHYDEHKDEYTHKNDDQLDYGKWYFHKFGNGSYKGGSFKGLDLTLGNRTSNKYCGILIRTLCNIDDDSAICGPSNSVSDLIGQHYESSVKKFMENKQSPLSVLSDENNKYIYIKDYEFPNNEDIYCGPRIGLSDKYPIWKNVNYRFVICKNKVKKQKRSLILL